MRSSVATTRRPGYIREIGTLIARNVEITASAVQAGRILIAGGLSDYMVLSIMVSNRRK